MIQASTSGQALRSDPAPAIRHLINRKFYFLSDRLKGETAVEHPFFRVLLIIGVSIYIWCRMIPAGSLPILQNLLFDSLFAVKLPEIDR